MDDETEYEMSFMGRASQKSLAFKFPHVDDISDVELKVIVANLPDLQEKGERLPVFPVDFSPYANMLC